MSAQRRTGTGPEMRLRRALHSAGLRFRVHERVEGARPDVLLTRARIAVFVMGDFWHSCPTHGTSPKSNAEWWAAKLAANRLRDERQRDALEAAGWRVVWVWECDDPEAASDRIRRLWRERTGRPGPPAT